MIIIHIPINRPVYLFGCICQKCVKILLFHLPTSIFHLNIILNSTTQNGFKIDSTTKSAWSYTLPLRLRIDLLLSLHFPVASESCVHTSQARLKIHHLIAAMNFTKIEPTTNAGTKLTLTAIPFVIGNRYHNMLTYSMVCHVVL